MNQAARQLTRVEEHNAIGAKFFSEGEYTGARMHFLAALYLEPDQPQVLQNLGAVLRQTGHLEAALAVAKKSVVLSGNNPFCRSNLGVSLLACRRHYEALEILEGVTKEMPEAGPSWHNYGLALYMIGKLDKALKAFDRALALNYNTLDLRNDRAMTLLALERIQDGLAAYESRWEKFAKGKQWSMGVQEWQGEDLAGRSILVHHEQGFGDSLMLCRFLHPLARLGAHITYLVPKELQRLMQRSFPFIRVINPNDSLLDKSAAFDFHSPLLSVVRWLGIKSPGQINSKPYLVGREKDAPKLPPARKTIGICWASGNHGPQLAERRRVIALTKFLPLMEIPGVQLVSLQKGQEEKEIETTGVEGLVWQVDNFIEDFANTADVISKLDLVISVDSAVAHVAGGLGKPTIVLSPYTRCWRWWSVNDGKPWYDHMRLFYQAPDGTWDDAMALAVERVRSWAAS